MHKIIKTETAYNKAIKRIEEIFDAEPNTPEGDELELLSLLVEKYEEDNYPIPDPHPIDTLEYYIEQKKLNKKELIGIIGDQKTVSKVLKCEIKLNLQMIRNLHNKLNIPYELLMKEY